MFTRLLHLDASSVLVLHDGDAACGAGDALAIEVVVASA